MLWLSSRALKVKADQLLSTKGVPYRSSPLKPHPTPSRRNSCLSCSDCFAQSTMPAIASIAMSSDLTDATGAAGAEKVVVEAAPAVSDVAELTV